jgi:hypothetical protein
MAQATSNPTRKPLSALFRDPFLVAAFRAAEDDGTAPGMVEIYTGRDRDGALVSTFRPRQLDGGAAEVIGDTGRRVRVLELVEA